MIRARLAVIIVSASLLWLVLAGRAMSMAVPEKLLFDLTWAGIRTGSASLESIPGKSSVRLLSTARSAQWVSVFFAVDDRVESVLRRSSADGPGLPLLYRVRLHEGRYKRDKEVAFDHAKQTASLTDRLSGETGKFPIRGEVFDPLSSFYHVRSLPMEPGRSLFVRVFDSKKTWKVEVQVLRRERITTQLGAFDTILIKPLMKSEGTFNRRGDIQIWLTDDARRLPVRMKTRVAVGSITATLVGGTF